METLISTLSSRAAQLFGDEPAFSMLGDCTVSFKQVADHAARVAGGLRALGVKQHDRVVLHLSTGYEWIIAYHAIARLGAVVVPANILLHADEVAFMAADSAAGVVLVSDNRCASVCNALGAAGRGSAVVVTTGSTESGCITFESLSNSAPATIENVSPEDLIAIGYTSGTTGKPKGAMLTHRNVFMSTALTATMHVRQRGEVILTALPLSHVYGNVVMNSAFLVGMRLIAMERFDAETALRAIQTEQVTIFEGVPTMYYYMLSHPLITSVNFSSLRRCTVGGQSMPSATINAVTQAFRCPLLELWGMTEVAGPAISHSPYLPAHPGAIGLPFPTMEVMIADADNSGPNLPPDTLGELLVRGSLVTSGYWRNEAATRAAFTPDGWFRTGDIGYRDTDGYVYMVDRKKDMIITGGYNIYPAELEQVISGHPAVAMVAVAGQHDQIKGELAKAFVVLRAHHELSAQDIIDYCRLHLAAYKVPRLVEFVDDLPKTSTGKIMRRALRSSHVGPPVTN